MSKIYWQGYEWEPRERWGTVHPDKPFVWYSPDCVNADKWDYLHLETRKDLHSRFKYHATSHEMLNYKPEYCVGLICSIENFSYGYFEIEAKLPSGQNLWPAFWMWGADSWPPEIDIFEGYTNKHNSYFSPKLPNLFGWWDVVPNFHYKEEGEKKATGTTRRYWGCKDPSKHFMKYSCLWTPDLIEIKYDGHIVKKITNKKLLKPFTGTKMRVIINNSFTSPPDEGKEYSDFVIKSFKYEKS